MANQKSEKDTPFNFYWIHFILSKARPSIYKIRQIQAIENKNIDLKRFFTYTLQKYTEYYAYQ